MPYPPKALIFDLDGVLIHSELLHRRTWMESLSSVGIQINETEQAYLQGRTAEQVIEWLRKREDAVEFDAEELIRQKRDRYGAILRTEVQPVPGVDEFLRRNKGKFPLALVTSARLKLVGQIMLVFNWRNIFDALVGADHVTHTKPHPEPYLHVADRLKLKPAECLVFEDSPLGIESARTAGMRICGVATTRTKTELRECGAQWIIDDFRDEAVLEMALAGVKPNRVVDWFGGFLKKK